MNLINTHVLFLGTLPVGGNIGDMGVRLRKYGRAHMIPFQIKSGSRVSTYRSHLQSGSTKRTAGSHQTCESSLLHEYRCNHSVATGSFTDRFSSSSGTFYRTSSTA